MRRRAAFASMTHVLAIVPKDLERGRLACKARDETGGDKKLVLPLVFFELFSNFFTSTCRGDDSICRTSHPQL